VNFYFKNQNAGIFNAYSYRLCVYFLVSFGTFGNIFSQTSSLFFVENLCMSLILK